MHTKTIYLNKNKGLPMRYRLLPVFLFAFLSCFVTLQAQVKVVSFKKLQEFLPQGEIQGFNREKPTGSTQTIMGITNSEAKVIYRKNSEDGNGITVTTQIMDATFNPYMLLQFNIATGYENETENGYEKSTVVKEKYPGRLSVTKSEGWATCKTEFGVMNRFFVSVQVEGTDDVKMIDKIISMMALDKLEVAQPDK